MTIIQRKAKGIPNGRTARAASRRSGELAGIKKGMLSESGETNIIAIILIIIVVIALAVIFRNQLLGIVARLFNRINGAIDDF